MKPCLASQRNKSFQSDPKGGVLIWLLAICCVVVISAVAEEPAEDLILSTADQIVTLNSDQAHLVSDLVSPMSGQLCLKHTDLIAKGAQDVLLSRSYIPPYIPKDMLGWNRNHKSAKRYDGEKERWALHKYLSDSYRGMGPFSAHPFASDP